MFFMIFLFRRTVGWFLQQNPGENCSSAGHAAYWDAVSTQQTIVWEIVPTTSPYKPLSTTTTTTTTSTTTTTTTTATTITTTTTDVW